MERQDQHQHVEIECNACRNVFVVLLDEHGRLPGCVRCPHCGQRTCGD